MTADSSEKPIPEAAGALPSSAPPPSAFSVHPHSAALIADGIVMERLRDDLDAIAAEYGEGLEPDANIELTRQHVMAVLTSLVDGLSMLLARPAGSSVADGVDQLVKFEHPTMSLLRKFIDALVDLDNAKKHEVFSTAWSSRGASLRKSEIRRREELLTLVDVIKDVQGLKTTAAAERELEKMMRKKLGHSGAIVTAKQLKELRKTRNRQRGRIQK